MNLQQHLDISQSEDEATFKRRLLRFGEELGFELGTAQAGTNLPGRGLVANTVGNVPRGFAEASMSLEDSRRDPVLTILKRSSVPFAYDQHFYVRHGAADLWEQQAQFGYKTGIAVAIHIPGRMHFYLGFDRARALPRDTNKNLTSLAILQLVAVHAQEAAFRVTGLQGDAQNSPRLTARELEVLQWTMEGKSAWAIGQILALSERTVNFHVRAACRKLNASSKHQAVVRALSLGLL